MPLVAAAVCPHPPLLVPVLAGAAAAELDPVRTACDAALARVLAAEPQALVLVGSATQSREYPCGAAGTLRRYGVDVPVVLGGGTPAGPPDLPLSLTIGAWLMDRQPGQRRLPGQRGRSGARPAALSGQAVADTAPVAQCAGLGARLAGTGRVALLVLGDGSACRGDKAPGYADDRAGAFDAAVTAALAAVDTAALLALDPALATALRAAGRAPWQVLAGAAGTPAAGLAGAVLYDGAPYGVQYTVAVWS